VHIAGVSTSPSPSANVYSRRWFATFLSTLDTAVIAREAAFLARQLPKSAFPSVLDLCCGTGRHLVPLALDGYHVTGLDRDDAALCEARRALRSAMSESDRSTLVRGDMRALPLAPASLDAVICMWQSFGYFDALANRRILEGIRRVLRPNGRCVLDVYHREFHRRKLAPRVMERPGVELVEHRQMLGDRLRVELRYGPDNAEQQADRFEWQLYTPEELAAEARAAGLTLRTACAAFDESRPPSAEEPRMQLVFEARTVESHA
jgi:SAM-dependent methyltransferase